MGQKVTGAVVKVKVDIEIKIVPGQWWEWTREVAWEAELKEMQRFLYQAVTQDLGFNLIGANEMIAMEHFPSIIFFFWLVFAFHYTR